MNDPKYARDDGMEQQRSRYFSTLLRVRCAQGYLIITETHIIVQLHLFKWVLRQESMERTAFAGIDIMPVVPAMINSSQPRTSFVFHGCGGQAIKADLVKGWAADWIIATFRGRIR